MQPVGVGPTRKRQREYDDTPCSKAIKLDHGIIGHKRVRLASEDSTSKPKRQRAESKPYQGYASLDQIEAIARANNQKAFFIFEHLQGTIEAALAHKLRPFHLEQMQVISEDYRYLKERACISLAKQQAIEALFAKLCSLNALFTAFSN